MKHLRDVYEVFENDNDTRRGLQEVATNNKCTLQVNNSKSKVTLFSIILVKALLMDHSILTLKYKSE